MTFLTYSSGELGMRRDVLNIRSCPAPDDSRPVLNILLVTDFAIDVLVRALFPGMPCRRHQVAGSAKVGIILDVVVRAITRVGYADNDQNQRNKQYYT